MSLIKDLRDKPSRLTVACKCTALNGIGYLGVGAILIVWITQTLFREPAFAGPPSRGLSMRPAPISRLRLSSGQRISTRFHWLSWIPIS